MDDHQEHYRIELRQLYTHYEEQEDYDQENDVLLDASDTLHIEQ
jgi:hypothetical protein